MKTKLFVLVIGLALCSYSAYSQDYVFKVLANKGDNTYKSASGSWEALKTGTKLVSGDVVKTISGSYLALIHASGKPLELKEAKEYKIDDLNSQMSGGETGIIGKYADFVASKMAPEEREENRKKYASVTGATERGFDQIKVYMKTTSNIYNSSAIIRWKPQPKAEEYELTLKDMFDEVIMVTETSDNFYKVDFNDSRLKDKDLVIVNVSVKGEKDSNSGDYGIQKVSADDSQTYKTELDELSAALDPNSSINNLILAEFYEQNNLLLDALTSYETAIQKSPDVDYFKDAYTEFLMRNQWSDKISN
jgi:hypothetical protein